MPKASGHVRCPKCDHRFTVNGAAPILMSRPVSPPQASVSGGAAATPLAAAPVATAAPLAEPAMPEPTPAPKSSVFRRVLGVVLGAAVFLAVGIGLLMFCLRNSQPRETAEEPVIDVPFGAAGPQSSSSPAGPTASSLQVVLAAAKTQLKPPIAPVKAGPLPGAVKPIALPPRPGVDQAKIDRAIDRGAAYLAKTAPTTGRLGYPALTGLTLLHCGRTADDPIVQSLARVVRQRAPSETLTYDLSLSIMFLDRLGDPKDWPLIQAIALQLIAGQGSMGGWNYTCAKLSPERGKQLLTALQSRQSANVPVRPTGRLYMASGDPNDLPAFQHRPGETLPFKPHGHEDNSNTQFAVLALWAAQKHGIPAEHCLGLVEARFRASQANDGSWSYTWTSPLNRVRPDSMTCAGLIGLAVGRGNVAIANLKDGDPAIENALRFVSRKIGAKGLPPRPRGKLVQADSSSDLYYLWTLERAAVVFDLQTIGGKDWYAWGAPIIVAHQGADGSWNESPSLIADTCFALLFLKRANVAQDLTVRLQHLAISKHIGERSGDLDRQPRPDADPFGRRSSLTASQREAAGYSRGRGD
ncbi:MAG: hypothetical protein L0Y71_08965 [Gemmataceae bacterium]|nr:hypothetical protein [Gemmataceae bacterium]